MRLARCRNTLSLWSPLGKRRELCWFTLKFVDSICKNIPLKENISDEAKLRNPVLPCSPDGGVFSRTVFLHVVKITAIFFHTSWLKHLYWLLFCFFNTAVVSLLHTRSTFRTYVLSSKELENERKTVRGDSRRFLFLKQSYSRNGNVLSVS